jgi:hypothetical protein
MHGANSVDIAEGALDELVELASNGQHQLKAAVPMGDSKTVAGTTLGPLRPGIPSIGSNCHPLDRVTGLCRIEPPGRVVFRSYAQLGGSLRRARQ